MTTLTPDHDSAACHAASENRRQVLEQLYQLAAQLDNCENEGRQAGSAFLPERINNEVVCLGKQAGAAAGVNVRVQPNSNNSHAYQGRYRKLDPNMMPLITFPETEEVLTRPQSPPDPGMSDEIQGGNVVRCSCVKRNGLQDQCPRSECRGSPECMTKPEPTCRPSQKAQPHEKVSRMNRSYDNNKADFKSMEICCQCPSNCHEQKQAAHKFPQGGDQATQQQQRNQPREVVCCYYSS